MLVCLRQTRGAPSFIHQSHQRIKMPRIINANNNLQNCNMPSPTYQECKDRIAGLLNRIPPQDDDDPAIRFLFFTANRMEPRVRTTFLKWPINSGQDLYIVKGVTEDYVYVYHASDLQTLITFPTTGPSPYNTTAQARRYPNVFNVDIVNPSRATTSATPSPITVGNHIDFSVHRTDRANPKVLVKTHYTAYESYDGVHWTRPSPEQCNFLLENSANPMCENLRHQPATSLDSFYAHNPPHVIPTIKALIDVLNTPQPPSPGGGRRTIHHIYTGSRGGRYKLVYGRRRYIPRQQHGGERPGYKGISFTNNDIFETYVYNMFVKKVYELSNRALDNVRIIYDEGHGNKNIIFIYEFGHESIETVRLFYIDAVTVFTAAYAEQRLTNNQRIDDTERGCHTQVSTSVQHIWVGA